MSEPERKCLDCGEPLTPVGFHMSIEDAQRCHAGHTQPEVAADTFDGNDCLLTGKRGEQARQAEHAQRDYRASTLREGEAAPLPDGQGSANQWWQENATKFPEAQDWWGGREQETLVKILAAYAASRGSTLPDADNNTQSLCTGANPGKPETYTASEACVGCADAASRYQRLIEENARLREALARERAPNAIRCGNDIFDQSGLRVYGCCRPPQHDGPHETLQDRHSGKYENEIFETILADLTDRGNLRPDGTRHKEGK